MSDILLDLSLLRDEIEIALGCDHYSATASAAIAEIESLRAKCNRMMLSSVGTRVRVVTDNDYGAGVSMRGMTGEVVNSRDDRDGHVCVDVKFDQSCITDEYRALHESRGLSCFECTFDDTELEAIDDE